MTEFAMNSAISMTTTFVPFKVNCRWLPTLFPEIDLNDTQFNGVKQFVEHAQQTVDAVHDAIIAHHIIQTHQANRRRCEEPNLMEGDLVYLSTADLNLPKGQAHKLLPKFIGLYPIITAQPEVSTYTLELPPELVNRRIHLTFHVSKLRPHIKNNDERFPCQEVITYYDFGMDPNTEWLVDSIIGHKWMRNKLEFHVKWNLGDTTWESSQTCEKLQALDAYLELQGVEDPKDLPRRR